MLRLGWVASLRLKSPSSRAKTCASAMVLVSKVPASNTARVSMIGSLFGLKGLIQSLWSIRRNIREKMPFVDLSIRIRGVAGEQRG